MILDDFHRLSGCAVSDSVAWFVDHLPPTFQLVLSTRREPALPLAALRAHGEMLELRADELRFTSEEADALGNGRLAVGLAPEDVDVLVERTEGWPTGLSVVLSLRGTADRHGFVSRFGAQCRLVTDFLVSEVLEAHDQPIQTLMLRSSILRRLSGPLCDAVREQQGSAAMLDTLSHTNLFLIPLDDQGAVPLPPPLRPAAADRASSGASRASPRNSTAACGMRGIAYHETTEEAIHHAFEANAYTEAAELIEASYVAYCNAARYNCVLGWLRRFPDEILNSDVRLLLVQAWVLSGLRSGRGRRGLSRQSNGWASSTAVRSRTASARWRRA